MAKMTSFLFSIALLFALSFSPVYADENGTVSIGSVEGKAGDSVSVTLKMVDCPGFSNLGFQIGYDSSVLTLTKVEKNKNVGATDTFSQSLSDNPYVVGWNSLGDVTYNGELATFTFSISKDATPGSYALSLNYYKGRNGNYVDGVSVNYDEDFTALNLNYSSGRVTVSPVNTTAAARPIAPEGLEDVAVWWINGPEATNSLKIGKTGWNSPDGGTLSYQWYAVLDEGKQEIEGATSETLVLTSSSPIVTAKLEAARKNPTRGSYCMIGLIVTNTKGAGDSMTTQTQLKEIEVSFSYVAVEPNLQPLLPTGVRKTVDEDLALTFETEVGYKNPWDVYSYSWNYRVTKLGNNAIPNNEQKVVAIPCLSSSYTLNYNNMDSSLKSLVEGKGTITVEFTCVVKNTVGYAAVTSASSSCCASVTFAKPNVAPPTVYAINTLKVMDSAGNEISSFSDETQLLLEVSLSKCETSTGFDFLFLVAYDVEGKMLTFTYAWMNPNVSESFGIGTCLSIPLGAHVHKVKTFIVSDFSTMTPLSEVREIVSN